MKIRQTIALAIMALIATQLSADDKAASPNAVSGEKIYAPTDLDGLRAAKGRKVSIEGTIVKQGESKSGTVRYLDFSEHYQDGISLVFMVSKGEGDFTREKLTNYVGKKVRVEGEIGEYKDKLQIEIHTLDQIKLVP